MEKNRWKLYMAGQEIFAGNLLGLIAHVVKNDLNGKDMAVYWLYAGNWILEDYNLEEDNQKLVGKLDDALVGAILGKPGEKPDVDAVLDKRDEELVEKYQDGHAAFAHKGPTFEYKVIEVNAGIDAFNELGRSGWEAIAPIRLGIGLGVDFILMMRTSPERNNFAKVFGSH